MSKTQTNNFEAPKDYEEVVRSDIEWWKPENIGDMVEGKIIDFPEGDYGKSILLETKDGKKIGTPSHMVIKSAIPSLKVGDEVKIIHSGTYKTDNGKGKDYKIFKKK